MNNKKNIYHILDNTFLFEVTDMCNLSCPYCHNPPEKNTFMDFINFKKAINILKENGFCNIVLSGGEPLLHPNLKEMLVYLDTHNFNVTLVTNACLMDDAWINFILGCKNITLQISLDGVDEKTNDILRGSGSYEKIIYVLNKLTESGYTGCTIRMTVSKINYLQTKEVFDYAIEKGLNPKFAFVKNAGRAISNWDDLALCLDDYDFVLKLFNPNSPKN